MTTVCDLVNQCQIGPIVVKLKNKKVEEYRDRYCSYIGYSFPEDVLLINRLLPQGVASTHVTYMDWSTIPPQNRSGYVANNFEMELIDANDKPAQEMHLAYEKYKWDCLDHNLHMNMTIGSSSEIFVEDDKGTIIPSAYFLGSKGSSNTLTTYGAPAYYKGFKSQSRIGVGTCLEVHATHIHSSLQSILHYASKVNSKAKLSARSLIEIPETELSKALGEQILFHDINSSNIYSMRSQVPNYRTYNLRPASGPIHFGVGEGRDVQKSVRALDAILGVACVSMFAAFDDVRRRDFVGKPGSYRSKTYGIEYRVLSNAWMIHPLIHHLVIDLGRKAIIFGLQGYFPKWEATEQETIDCILKSDVPKSREILARNRNTILKIIQSIYKRGEDNAALVYSIFLNGMESILATPTDIYRNWGLNGHIGTQPHHRWVLSYDKINNGIKI